MTTGIDHPVTITHRNHHYNMMVRTWGTKDASCHVVVIPGVAQHRCWADFFAPALKDVYVVSQDQLGRGNSDWLEDTHIDDYYDFDIENGHTEQMIKAIGVKTPFVWIGTSSGAAMGIKYAAAHPDKVKALVINDISPIAPAATMQALGYLWKEATFPSRDAWIEIAIKAGLNFGPGFSMKQWEHLAATSLKPATPSGFIRAHDLRIGRNFMKVAETGINLIETREWQKVTCPILFIYGEKSVFVTATDIAQMREHQPQMQIHKVPESGHAPAIHDPDTQKALADFLNRYGR